MFNTQTLDFVDILYNATRKILKRSVTRNEKLFAICELLADEVPTFDWVGFYLIPEDAKDELVLGPFVGKRTYHSRIPFGTGICGQVALSHKTYVSQNVEAEENYLACSLKVKSEVVVPIMVEGEFVGQIDVDSYTKGSITEDHVEALEIICEMLCPEFEH